MKAKDFINLLQQRLTHLSLEEKNDIIFYYDELICGGMEKGLTEEESVERLGGIDDIIDKLFDEGIFNKNTSIKNLNIDLKFSKKLFSKNLVLENTYNTISINSRFCSVVVKDNFDDEINISHFNTLFSKVGVYQNTDELIIKRKKNHMPLSIILSVLFYIILFFLPIAINGFRFPWWIWIICGSVSGAFSGLIAAFKAILKVDKLTILIPPNKRSNLNLISSSSSTKLKNINLNNLYAQTSAGSFTLFNCSVNLVNLKASSGSIRCITESLEEPKVIKSAKLLSYSGSIACKNIHFENLLSKCKSGSVIIKNSIVDNQFESQASSGSLVIKDCNISKSFANTSSGSVIVKRTELKGNAILNSSSGSVIVKNSNISDIDLKAKSGSVIVKDTQTKNIIAYTSSGSILLKKLHQPRLAYNLNLTTRFGGCRVKEIPKTMSVYSDSKNEAIEKKYSIDAQAENGHISVSFYS